VIAVSVLRHLGFRQFIVSGVLVCVVSAVSLWPMLTTQIEVPIVESAAVPIPSVIALSHSGDPPLPTDFEEVMSSAGTDFEITEPLLGIPDHSADRDSLSESVSEPPGKATGEGLSAFMSSWKMNDLFFLIVNENLSPGSAAWFAVLPDDTKRQFISPVTKWTNQSDAYAAFLVSRVITAAIHIFITAWLAAVAWRANLRQLPGLVFLSVAWFWLLLPTLNPWYWIWAMPLLPFVRLRSWLLTSGCVALYYSRFWLQNTWGARLVPGTTYDGKMFFNFVVVWLEYVPLLVILCVEYYKRSRHR
jgi:hypothetical protein